MFKVLILINIILLFFLKKFTNLVTFGNFDEYKEVNRRVVFWVTVGIQVVLKHFGRIQWGLEATVRKIGL